MKRRTIEGTVMSEDVIFGGGKQAGFNVHKIQQGPQQWLSDTFKEYGEGQRVRVTITKIK